jgi:hypothetical protein
MTQRTADRLIQATTVTSTATVTLGAAWTGGFQTLAQAMAADAGKPGALVVGAKGLEFCVLDPNTGAWETSSYTITDATTLTRDYVLSSSNNGLPVPFAAGTKQVICVASSSRMAAGLVDPDDVGFDIVGCYGQSNMEGNPASDPDIDINDPRVYQWSTPLNDATHRHQILGSTEPLYMVTGVRTGKTGPATHFARAYLSTVPGNRKVLLVPVAAGSTGLVGNYWQPGSPGGQGYETAIAEANLAIAAAIAMFPNSRYVGTIWAQGEADALASIPQWQYAMNLKALIAGMRSRITGAASSWFVISSMTLYARTVYSAAQYDPIDSAHKQIAAEVNRVGFVPPVIGMDNNSEHYTAPGIRIMGARMGLAVRAASRSVGVDSTVPTLVAASVANASPSTVTLTFSEVLDGAYIPSVTNLASSVSGHTVSNVALAASGNVLNLGLTTPFAAAESRSFTYPKPATNYLRDLTGNPVADGVTMAITDNVAGTGGAVAPDAPTIGVAVAGDGYVDVAFTAPASNGGSAILDYTAYLSTGESATSSASPIRVTAANGTARTATAKARNAIGYSAASAASNSVTPAAAGGGGGGTFTTMSTTDKDASITLSGGSLIATGTVAGFKSARAISGKSTGKWYFEATIGSIGGSRVMIGFGAAAVSLTDFAGSDGGGLSAGYDSLTGTLYAFGGGKQTQSTYTAGDVIGVALDLTNNTVQFFKNGAPQTQVALWAQITGAKPLYPMITTNSAGGSLTMNFGASAFTSLPAGFSGWTP